MNIFYSDEENKLSGELLDLMQKAGETALRNEFGDALSELGYDIDKLPVDVSFTVGSAGEIKELNAQFRDIDKITDVLSFPQYADNEDIFDELVDLAESMKDMEDDEEVPFGVLLGDVFICYERAAEQAEEYGTGLKRELVYLFVHSIFHLLGYDHMEEAETAEMRAREEAVMEVVGL